MARTNLNVPYKEKDDAKRLDARWDVENKVWFVPDGVDPVTFQRWIPNQSQSTLSAIIPHGPERKLVVQTNDKLPDNLFNRRRIQSTNEIHEMFWQDNRLYLLVPNTSVLPYLTAGGAETDETNVFIRRGTEINLSLLHDCLPFVAKSVTTPILGDLIPITSWGSSLFNLVSPECWRKLRHQVLAVTGFRCEICGSDQKLECHESWEYHEPTPEHSARQGCGVQRLIRMMGLCDPCHETQHLGLANVQGRSEIARKRIKAYNRWNEEELHQYCDFIDERSDRRSHCSWVLDLSCVKETLQVQSKWQIQENGFLFRDTKLGGSETLILGVAWQHNGILHPAVSADHGYYE